MSGRLWYPQLDVYDAVRRMAGLLLIWDSENSPSEERLYIADFYLATPALIHRTSMSKDVRRIFYELNVTRPEKSFVNLPSAPVLFQKMEVVQRHAFQTLVGKGLVELTALEVGRVALSHLGIELIEESFLPLFSSYEHDVASFLAESLANPAVQDLVALRRGTGLRRVL